jgi:O-antigen/teichoic acid export membrane protein
MQVYTEPAPAERPNIERQASSAAVYAFVGKFGNSVLAFPITLLLVKGLSVQDYGAYSLFISLLYFASVCTNLGTTLLSVRSSVCSRTTQQ